MKWLVFLCSVALLSCNMKEENSTFFPIFSDNQSCVTDYLDKIKFKGYEILPAPFNIEYPHVYSGIVKLTPNKRRNMQAIYNKIRLDCYAMVKRSTKFHSDDLTPMFDDIHNLATHADANIDQNKTIYIELDIPNKTYSVFQKNGK